MISLMYAGEAGTVSKKFIKSGDVVSTDVTLGTYRFVSPVNVYKSGLESLR